VLAARGFKSAEGRRDLRPQALAVRCSGRPVDRCAGLLDVLAAARHQPPRADVDRLDLSTAAAPSRLMDLWNQLLQGFATAGTPINLLWALLGCTIGTAIGVLPGIGPGDGGGDAAADHAQGRADGSMIFFAGIYYGAMYGGSTTSILLNTPGRGGSMVTAMEGNRMAKNGRAGAALATAAIGSFVAGRSRPSS
jgi:hypothetical protein